MSLVVLIDYFKFLNFSLLFLWPFIIANLIFLQMCICHMRDLVLC